MTLSNYSITGEPADCVGSSNIKSIKRSINGAERNKSERTLYTMTQKNL